MLEKMLLFLRLSTILDKMRPTLFLQLSAKVCQEKTPPLHVPPREYISPVPFRQIRNIFSAHLYGQPRLHNQKQRD